VSIVVVICLFGIFEWIIKTIVVLASLLRILGIEWIFVVCLLVLLGVCYLLLRLKLTLIVKALI
jgi:hypothetical protein